MLVEQLTSVIDVLKQKKHILPLLKDNLIVKLETVNEYAYVHIKKTEIDVIHFDTDVDIDVHIISDTVNDILQFMNGEMPLKEVKRSESIRMVGKLKDILRLEVLFIVVQQHQFKKLKNVK